MLETKKCHCPYCGELIEVVVDLSMGEQQEYIEDCFVCCRPIVLSIQGDIESGDCELRAVAEND